MPGTSENFEINHFNGIANRLVEPTRALINHYPLQKLLTFLLTEVPEELTQAFPSLSAEQWRDVLRKTIISKITALELNADYSHEQLYFLIDLLSHCFQFQDTRKIQPKDLPKECVYAQKWLNQAYAHIRLKHPLSDKKGR
ncbi:hypothetical protein THMIRHAS_07710 [Thiosulfatimonas sediminis]|uniref:Uncharacterized protein n=1 Tax=Thiosulfatimonas sediminis TaxID=2675054 RepID=A0A6F8PTR4_9GAMM|nr:hypothetical protein [Thiosulfatimonas sediminis]BBP45398.1 hypothetical protein THMIRHAS_07710 [Thiosulfatimonas sediminis]